VALEWTTLGILTATFVASFFYLGNKIDVLGSELRGAIGETNRRIDRLSERIDAQGAELNARIDALGTRLDARIDALGERMDHHLRGDRPAG
jgi:hypothetical protein